jgi:hypothetical protein
MASTFNYEYSDPGSIPGWVNFFLFFLSSTIYLPLAFIAQITFFFTYCHREVAGLGSLPPQTSKPLSPQGLFFLALTHSTLDLSRQHHLHTFSQKLKCAWGNI